MTNVYAWPPVSTLGREWTVEDYVQRTRSMWTRRVYESTSAPTRRMATVVVSGMSCDMNGAGYVESLKVLLAGKNLVRLYSPSINHRFLARVDPLRASEIVTWESSGTAVTWDEGGTAITWARGRYLTGTTGTDAKGFTSIAVSGLLPNTLAARPSEFVTIYEADETPHTVRVVTAATADASGDATLRVFGTLPSITDGRVNIGTQDTAVFRPMGPYPRAVQPPSGDWAYQWDFREVFEAEVDGGFTEVDPWS